MQELTPYALACLGCSDTALVLLWLLVRKCLASRSGAVVARVLSVLLCAALAVGYVWAQQGLTSILGSRRPVGLITCSALKIS